MLKYMVIPSPLDITVSQLILKMKSQHTFPLSLIYRDIQSLKILFTFTFPQFNFFFLLCGSVVKQSLLTTQKDGQEECLGNVQLEPY